MSNFKKPDRERRRQSDEVVAAIMSMLERGELRQGDVLPPERDLAQRFDVGRNTLREAIRVLQVYGLVDRRPRLGTVVRRANMDHMLEIAFSGFQITRETFDEIQEFRQIIETGIAALVASRCSAEHLDELTRLNEAMAGTLDVREQAVLDYRFHAKLLELSGNAIMSRTYRVLGDPIRRLMELGKGTHGTQAAFEQHGAMIAALRKGDAQEYAQLLGVHLAHGRRYLLAMPGAKQEE